MFPSRCIHDPCMNMLENAVARLGSAGTYAYFATDASRPAGDPAPWSARKTSDVRRDQRVVDEGRAAFVGLVADRNHGRILARRQDAPETTASRIMSPISSHL